MKDTKKWRNTFDIYDKYRLAEYFESQAREGWILTDSPGSSFLFRRAEPTNLHYAIVYCSGRNDFESEPTIQQKTLYDFCACSGWKLVTRKGVFQVFCNAQRDPVPIETEPEIELMNIHHGYRSATIGIKICSIAGVTNIFSNILRLLIGTETKFSNAGFNWTLIILLLVYLIGECSYLLWYRRAKESVNAGLGIPPVNHSGLKRISVNILLCIASVNLIVSFFISQTKLSGTTTFVGVILLIMASLWFGKNLRDKAFANKHGNHIAVEAAHRKLVISIIVLVFAWIILIVLIAAVAIMET